MPVINKIQNSFTSGELDPKLRARNDTAMYYAGASKLRNVFSTPQGGVKRRPGLEFILDIDDPDVRLYEFPYSGSDTYLMVLTPAVLKVYKNDVLKRSVGIPDVTQSRLPDVTFAQSNDTFLIFHEEFAPIAVTRESDSVWSAGSWSLDNIPTFNFSTSDTTADLLLKKTDGAEIDFTDWVDGTTFTARADADTAGTFSASDVGRFIRSSSGGYAEITGYTDSTRVTIKCLTAFEEDIATGRSELEAGKWDFEDYVWSAERGYPRCGAFYQGRLWMASTPDIPNGIWASKTNSEHDFANWIPEFDDHGIFLIAKDAKDGFHTAHVGQHLCFLSTQAAMYISTPSQEAVTPRNPSVRPMISGAGAEQGMYAYDVNNTTVFLRNGGRSVLQNSYSFAKGLYETADLNLLASHVIDSPVCLGYRRQTNTDVANYLMVCNSDGTLAVLNILTDQEITAWTVCETDGYFLAAEGVGEDIYCVVRRVIDGSYKYYIEKFNDALYVDSGVNVPGSTQLTYAGVDLTYDDTDLTYGASSLTITGLDHLEGEEVQIIANNTVDAAQTVGASGEVTTTISGGDAQAGLNFPIVDTDTSSRVYIESMPIEIEDSGGSISVGSKKRVSEVSLMLYETSHCTVMSNDVTIRRLGDDTLDAAVPQISDTLTIQGILGWYDEIQISVAQTLPLPFTLLGMAYKVKA